MKIGYKATFVLLVFFLIVFSSCREGKGTLQPSMETPNTVVVTEPLEETIETDGSYRTEKDPVKKKVMYYFSASDLSRDVWIDDERGTIQNGFLSNLLDFSSWERTSETSQEEPELLIDCGAFRIEVHKCLVKVAKNAVPYPNDIDFDVEWYRLSNEAEEKTHIWIKTVNLDRYAYIGGAKIFKFVHSDSAIYRLKNTQPVKILFHEDDGEFVNDFSTNTGSEINDIMGRFSDLRVMEKIETPKGQELMVTFILEDSTQIVVRFIDQCLEYEGDFYSLYTGLGFFRRVEQVREGITF